MLICFKNGGLLSVNKGSLFMSITKQRWQLTRSDSTLEYFSSTQMKLLEHTSVGLRNFKKNVLLYSFSFKLWCVCQILTFWMALLKIHIKRARFNPDPVKRGWRRMSCSITLRPTATTLSFCREFYWRNWTLALTQQSSGFHPNICFVLTNQSFVV